MHANQRQHQYQNQYNRAPQARSYARSSKPSNWGYDDEPTVVKYTHKEQHEVLYSPHDVASKVCELAKDRGLEVNMSVLFELQANRRKVLTTVELNDLVERAMVEATRYA